MPPFADVLQWEHLPFPKSLRDFQRLFPDDDACARYLEGAKWPKGFTCPHCQEKGEPVRLATRPGVLACRACRKQTSLTVDTVMQRTHTPLTVWFWAAYLVSSMTPGMSAVQFQRQLGLTRYETAFQILHKLRAGMVRQGRDRIGGNLGRNDHVEIDETYIRRFYPFNAFRSLLGIGTNGEGPTYDGIYEGTWKHPTMASHHD
jgi:hypothetical protein